MNARRNPPSSTSPGLPDPGPAALAHSRRLVDVVAREIKAANGVIPFSRYMEMVLYEPGLGYYSAGTQKFGEGGDFVTAPEVSQLFSACLADQCGEVLAQLQGGAILELGAGSGTMAATILERLASTDRLPDRYLILEVSGDLRQRQRETLRSRVPEQLDRVQWLDRWPAALAGVVLGNEVLDALPVERFRLRNGNVQRLGVARARGRFELREMGEEVTLTRAVRAIEADLGRRLPEAYESEVSLRLPGFIRGVADSLTRGVALFVDYGLPRREFYMSERRRGTLMCHYRHRAHADPFLYPGLQDITAWVDFTAVAEAAVEVGCPLLGYATQAHFLIGAGIDRLLEGFDPGRTLRELKLAQEVKLLTLPGEMGERFKAIAFARGEDFSLSGFRFRDLREQL
jgi:SAM-dependent MidA family methyltransferase